MNIKKYILEAVKSQRVTKEEAVELLLHCSIENEKSETYLHPLLHKNSSDVFEVLFSSRFDGNELFITDYSIKGGKALPEVCHLEMARVATSLALRADGPIQLSDILWLCPAGLNDEGLHLQIGIVPISEREIRYDIFSVDKEGEKTVFGEGQGCVVEEADQPFIDVESLKTLCAKNTMATEQFYSALSEIGMRPGPGFQSVVELKVGSIEIGERQALAKLELPSSLSKINDAYVLNPGILDGAVQASIGLSLFEKGQVETPAPSQPFSLDSVRIYESTPAIGYAWVRYSTSSIPAGAERKLDISICDEQGKVCAELEGLGLRAPIELNKSTSHQSKLITVTPEWNLVSVEKESIPPLDSSQAILVGGTERQKTAIRKLYPKARVLKIGASDLISDIAKHFEKKTLITKVIWISPAQPKKTLKSQGIVEEQDKGVLQVFKVIKALLQLGYGERKLHWTVVTTQAQPVIESEEIDPTHAGVHGLIGSLAKEYPGWKVRLLDMEKGQWPVQEMLSLPYSDQGNALAYRNKEWFAQELVPVNELVLQNCYYKSGGVYVVIGGAGGIGEVWSRWVIKEYQAKVIWIGRRKKDAVIEAKIESLASLGHAPVYIQADASDKKSLEEALIRIKKLYPKINAVIHSVVGLFDFSLPETDEHRFREILSAKINTSVYMSEVFHNEALDFLLFFSSMAAFGKYGGFSGYAAGCTFEDAFAFQLSKICPYPVKVINWGYWDIGSGDRMSEGLKNRQALAGVEAIQPDEGMEALEKLLNGPLSQIAFAKTSTPIVTSKANSMHSQFEKADLAFPCDQIDEEILRGKSIAFFKNLLGGALGIPIHKLDILDSFESYGLDSILVRQITSKLEEVFGDISSTLLFEVQTISGLVEYFLEARKESLAKILGVDSLADGEEGARLRITDSDSNLLISKSGTGNTRRFLASSNSRPHDNVSLPENPVAIVGVNGRYPQARDLDEYWENLKSGKDCIVEIAEERWSLEGFFHPDAEEAIKQGKSYSKWGGFLDGFSEFDPLFFGISPREAINMDPQERLFLQSCWELFEEAGYSRDQLARRYQGKVGVFAGITKTGFALYGPDLRKQGKQLYPHTSFSSLVNRVSYFFNLCGPSVPIDTMCSSSLTAIHEACASLNRNECELAIAGGVNLYLHPTSYVELCRLQMLSKDGRCKSFGADGNGFVPGEGVGTVLLKPLSRAVTDGDHIYGVIRGTAINHGGKTNGYMVPDPNAHANLIAKALERAQIDPREISYIEAHGTGTELGDPIEIAGLSKAFSQSASSEPLKGCSIGSVKSNIGHLEAAAGIAGVAKVLLQMQHRQLAPSLNSSVLNPNINFDKTPFHVQQELEDWNPATIKINGNEKGSSRIAGISSFGAGGSNAHVIIEEYIPATVNHPVVQNPNEIPAIIILSAKTEDQLTEQVHRLLAWIQEKELGDADLPNIAYTLQLSREAMDERLAFTANNLQDVVEELGAFVDGESTSTELVRGNVRNEKEALLFLKEDEDGQRLIATWLAGGKYEKALGLWVKGFSIDWLSLYQINNRPTHIRLPTYPFCKESYWVSSEEGFQMGRESDSNGDSLKYLHPLLQQNSSDMLAQRFTSIFTGEEIFLSSYSINGQQTFSEALYLEMAREAIVRSASRDVSDKEAIRMKNVSWVNYVAKEYPILIHINLWLLDSAEIGFEIYSDVEDGTLLHCQGTGEFFIPPAMGSVLVSSLLNASHVSKKAQDCYQYLESIGLDYGPVYRGIEEFYVTEGQSLVKLRLPESASDTLNQYTLNPSLLVSACQAVMCLEHNNSRKKSDSILTNTLDVVEVLGECSAEMWALVQVQQSEDPGSSTVKFDIDLCDSSGAVCIHIGGLGYEKIHNQEDSSNKRVDSTTLAFPAIDTKLGRPDPYNVLAYEETWQECRLDEIDCSYKLKNICVVSDEKIEKAVRTYTRNLSMTGECISIIQTVESRQSVEADYQVRRGERDDYEEVFRDIIERFGSVDAILYINTDDVTDDAERHTDIAMLLQALGSEKLQVKRILLAGSYATELQRCHLESWIVYKRSLGLVLPNIEVGVVISETSQIETWITTLWRELYANEYEGILYKEGRRHIAQVCEVQFDRAITESQIKAGGTYLITGGCGGLGLLFSEHLAEGTGINLVLLGRSRLNSSQQSRIEKLRSKGCLVEYLQIDINNQSLLKEMLSSVLERFGSIQGVIHAAGVQSTKSILEKSGDDIADVLAPKVQGTLVLEGLLDKQDLDFVCYFSSSSAILGDLGSCDYAIGNRFLMTYGDYRQTLVTEGKKRGRTLVINWPLWEEGGMKAESDEYTKMYLKSSGQQALDSDEGKKIFDILLNQGSGNTSRAHKLIFVGQRKRIDGILKAARSKVLDFREPSTTLVRERREELKGLTLLQCIEWDLKEKIYEILDISHNRIGVDENFVDIGFDSISLQHLAASLSQCFQLEITPSLFFTHISLSKLCNYLMKEYQELLAMIYGEKQAPQRLEETIDKAKNHTAINKAVHQCRRMRRTTSSRSTDQEKPEPIAIIGMGGRFPKARNIDELWKILSEGNDAVEEIPLERFDWRDYYGDPAEGKLKANCKWCGCIPGADEFDSMFFEISPREAEQMDPRQRLLLQESWNALEMAGVGENYLENKKVGMFVGVEQASYPAIAHTHTSLTGNNDAMLASRLSYFLNLSGPVLAINTSCSSGLVAAHQACLSLRSNECDAAIVAGVNLILSPLSIIAMSHMGMLSSDGKCFSFDKRANGLVPGEAVAVVVLKRLSQAEEDGDQIYGVIKGSGINYDGRTNGITAPSGKAQSNLFTEIYNKNEINPAEIEYIVTHGTGTRLGDPVEINALDEAFKAYTTNKNYCALTSTKTNFGHTFAASGLVSLISAVQSMRHETIPASLHCDEESDYVNWEQSPFYVNKENMHWPEVVGRKRLSAVSAFGISGTNAHMVLESYFTESETGIETDLIAYAPDYLLVVSAKTEEALQDRVKELIFFLENRSSKNRNLLAQISYTLGGGRHHFQYRKAIVVRNVNEAIQIWEREDEFGKDVRSFAGDVAYGFIEQKAVTRYVEYLVEESDFLKEDETRYQETLYALASLYCQGYSIPWNRLFGQHKPLPIALPTYPFARDVYPLPVSNEDANSMVVATESGLDCSSASHTIDEVESSSKADVGSYISDFLSESLSLPLGMIDPEKDIYVFGGDSIVLLKLTQGIEQVFGVKITHREMMDHRSVTSLSSLLQKRLGHTPNSKQSVLNDHPAEEYRNSTKMELHIREFLSEILGLPLEMIAPEKDFYVFGVDSIILLKLTQDIEQNLGVKITQRELVDHRSVASLSSLLQERLSRTPKSERATFTAQSAKENGQSMGETGEESYGELDPRTRKIEVLNRFKNGEISVAEATQLIKETMVVEP